MLYALWIDADQRFAFSLAPVPGAVEITEEHHALMMDAQSIGMVITRDEDGKPLAILNPGPSSDETWAALRIERDRRLAAATAILDRHRNQRDFGLTTTLTEADAVAWATYAQSLRDLPEATSDPAAPKWPVEPGQAPTAA